MSLFQITKDEFKSLGKNKIKIIALFAVIAIPLLYSFLYLKAYWDPYGDLKNYPIAVVNNDKGALMNDENVNYGEDLIDNLKDNRDVGFEFVDISTAEQGIKDDKYFATIEIPEDFSQNIVDAKNGTVINPKLNYISNNKKNYIGTKISDSIKNEILKEINKSISKNYGKVAFETIYELKDGLQDASDGVSELADGESKLYDGGKELSDGLSKLNDQVPVLQDGVESLADGANKLYDGGKELSDGLNKLNDQVPVLQDGVKSLADGSDKLNEGLSALNSKMPLLSNSTNQLSDGAKALKDGVAAAKVGADKITTNSQALKDGASNVNSVYENQVIPGYKSLANGLKDGADQLKLGSSQVRDGVNSLINATAQNQATLTQALTSVEASLTAYLAQHPAEAADQNMQVLLSTMQGIKNQLAASQNNSESIIKLQNGLNSLAAGTENLSNQLDLNNSESAVYTFYAGLNNFNKQALKPFTEGVNSYVDGTNQLAAGVSELNAGASKLYDGMSTLKSSMPTLAEATSKLYDGSSALKNGTNELNSKVPVLASGVSKLSDGSNKLTSGLSSLKNGTNQLNAKVPALASGVSKLSDGSNKLTDGLSSLKDGTSQLQDGLNDGIKKIDDNIKSTSEDLGEFIGEPVKVSEETLGSANNYGSGLTPYFLPISLWLGAVFMLFAIKINNKKYEELGQIKLTIGKFIPYSLIGIVQALLLGGIVLLLGIEPTNLPLLFAFLILMALSFDAIIYTLFNLLGLAGEAIAVVLLVLQLCSDAGTFPMEVLPNFFKGISTFLPFTYSVSAIRELLFSVNMNNSLLIKDAIIIAAFGLIFMIINMIFIRKGEVINEAIEEGLAA